MVSDAKTLDLRDKRLTPGLYVIGAITASLLNALTSRSIRDDLGFQQYRDVLLILGAFTAVALFSTCVQFALARMFVGGRQVPTYAVPLLALASAITTFVASYAGISGPSSFKTETGLLLAAAAFGAVLPSRTMARLLVARQWLVLGLVLVVGAVVRLIAWLPDVWSSSPSRVLGGLVVAQFASAAFAVAAGRTTHTHQPAPIVPLPRLLPASLLGLVAVVGLSLVARRSNLGLESDSYVVGMFVGRTIFFTALVATYVFLPDLLQIRNWSLSVRSRVRRAWAFTLIAAVGGLISGLYGIADLAEALVGRGWESNASVLAIVILGWALLSIAVLPFFYLICLGSRFSRVIFVAVCVMLFGQLFASSEMSLALFFLVASMVLVGGVAVPVVVRQRAVVRPIVEPVSVLRSIPASQSLSVVIPSYNPGSSVLDTIRFIREAFDNRDDVRVIAVSDGSTDDSVELLNGIVEPWFTHVNLGENRGKGAALLAGFDESTSTYTAFIDADGDIPPRLLVGMFEAMEAHAADIVFGSKWHPSSRLDVSKARWLLSRVHHLIQVILFDVNIDDTQAGIKIYRTDVLRQVRPMLRETGFSLDLELFVAFAAVGHRKFIEAPIVIERSGASTIRLRHVVQSFLDMLSIFWRARIGLEYHRAASES